MNFIDEEGYTGETRGFLNVHNEDRYRPIYEYISRAIDRYLEAHSVSYENFDVNFVKSWLNVIRDRDTPGHSHGDAQYSFIYYVNIPEDSQTEKLLTFENPFSNGSFSNPNEGFKSMFANNVSENGWNYMNSYSWSFKVNEGELFVFPSHLKHHTTTNGVNVTEVTENPYKTVEDLKNKRVCIAGDVVLTYSKKAPKSTGLQPIKNWKVF